MASVGLMWGYVGVIGDGARKGSSSPQSHGARRLASDLPQASANHSFEKSRLSLIYAAR